MVVLFSLIVVVAFIIITIYLVDMLFKGCYPTFLPVYYVDLIYTYKGLERM